MNISPASKFSLALCAFALCVLVTSSFYVVHSALLLEQFTETRFNSVFLAEEIRATSKALTSHARAFVETGDSFYENQYRQLREIRQGVLPRPKDARVAPGLKIPVVTLMDRVGYSLNEMHLLRESLSLSEQLAQLEEKAMNMAKGLFQEKSGDYIVQGDPDPNQARSLLFGEEYDRYVRQIMLPSFEFDKRLDSRILLDQAVAEDHMQYAFLALAASVVLLLLSLLMAFLFFRRRLSRPLAHCSAFAHQLGQGDYAAKYTGPNLPEESALYGLVLSFHEIANHLKRASLLACGDEAEASHLRGLARASGDQADSVRQEREEFETRAALFDCMSHEIRTPMNSITGLTDLLCTEALTPVQRKHIQDIRNAATALYKTVNDIIDFAKIDSDAFEVIETDYNLLEVVDALDSISRVYAMSKHLEFIVEKEYTLPICLYGDGERVQQVLLTLLSNAIKHTEAGYVRFCIAEEEAMIRYEIHDTGVSMTRDRLKTLFNPYTTAVLRHRQGMESSGLSFYLAKKLVEHMGGSIDVQSREEFGTSFFVRLPKKLGDSATIFGQSDSAPTSYRWDATALVVDDNLINIEVACALLEYFGLKADTVLSGQSAIDKVAENRYDIILMDHLMPEMDGMETTLAIRGLGGWCTHVPIVALTANVSAGVRQTLLGSSMNDFLGKPIGINMLCRALMKWLPEDKKRIQTDH